jgi:hypothetical protein
MPVAFCITAHNRAGLIPAKVRHEISHCVPVLPETKTPRFRQKASQDWQETQSIWSNVGGLPSIFEGRMAPVGHTPTQRPEREQLDVKDIFPKS